MVRASRRMEQPLRFAPRTGRGVSQAHRVKADQAKRAQGTPDPRVDCAPGARNRDRVDPAAPPLEPNVEPTVRICFLNAVRLPVLLCLLLLSPSIAPPTSADTVTGEVVNANGAGLSGTHLDFENLGTPIMYPGHRPTARPEGPGGQAVVGAAPDVHDSATGEKLLTPDADSDGFVEVDYVVPAGNCHASMTIKVKVPKP